MAIAYLGGSSNQNNWGHNVDVSPTATEATELWVVCGFSVWGYSPTLYVDSVSINDQHGFALSWCGLKIGWTVVEAGSHTASITGGVDSTAISVMRFKGFNPAAYLDYGQEAIYYGTEAPFPNADLTAIAGGMAAAAMCCAANDRTLYIQSGGTIVGQYTTRTPCDGKSCRFGWGYRLPLTSSTTESCYFTQSSYTTDGQGATHMSFAPGGAAGGNTYFW
jgi:hypothetical protein